jgi:hypothetical protein
LIDTIFCVSHVTDINHIFWYVKVSFEEVDGVALSHEFEADDVCASSYGWVLGLFDEMFLEG